MPKKFKAEIRYFKSDEVTPEVKEFEADSVWDAEEEISKYSLEATSSGVSGRISVWDEESKSWYTYSDKDYFNANQVYGGFMLLSRGAHEYQILHSWAEALVVHTRSFLSFTVNLTEQVEFHESMKQDPDNVFYRFKYTARNGRVWRFVLHCYLPEEKFSPEQRSEIRENVLIPGAKWYCKHFAEKYRNLLEEDAYTRMMKDRENRSGK